jgi:hypothetical protein
LRKFLTAGWGVQDKKKLDEVWPQNPWESVVIVFCYYLCTCRVVLTMISWTTHVCPVGWWVSSVTRDHLSFHVLDQAKPSVAWLLHQALLWQSN